MSETEHIQVVFENADGQWTAEVPSGSTLLEAAWQCSAPVHTLCNGIGACVQCKVRVVEGDTHLSTPEALEKELIGNIFHITKERLACQARAIGAVKVEPLPMRLPKKSRASRRTRGRR